MIQELLGMVEERSKFCLPGSLLLTDTSSSSPTSSFSSSPAASSSSPSSMSTSSDPQQNLRCPRCDSSNTKFCYYNNYNLTQPRHFCKTCRRYWTKGGALRNVPIGGGCRKVKPSPTLLATRLSGAAKAKSASSPDLANHDMPTPIMWAPPYSSQLLDLLRANQVQNHNFGANPTLNLTSMRIKEDAGMFGYHKLADPGEAMTAQGFGLDTLGQLNGSGNYPFYQQQPQPTTQQHNMLIGEMQSLGVQELLQRLRSSGNFCNSQLPMTMNNAASLSPSVMGSSMASSGASILEPLPLSGGDMGYWNSAMSWADLSTANGGFR